MTERLSPFELVRDFNEDRPLFKRDFSGYIQGLLGEIEELVEAYENGNVEEEIADVLIYVISIAYDLGIDPDEAIRTKVALNHMRYPAKEFQEGDYEETRKRLKREEKRWKDLIY